MNKKIVVKVLVVSLIIILAVAWRLVTPWANVSPVMAIALFAGAFMAGRRIYAYLIPLAAMGISDLFLGYHDTLLAVYISFVIAVYIGYRLRSRINVKNVLFASVAGSVVFFVLTNFAVWITGMVGYPMTLPGLGECYIAAIPFFRTELLSTLGFSILLFGSYSLVKARVPVLAS